MKASAASYNSSNPTSVNFDSNGLPIAETAWQKDHNCLFPGVAPSDEHLINLNAPVLSTSEDRMARILEFLNEK